MAEQLLDKASYSIIRTNPKLTGNVKVVSDGTDIYLESFRGVGSEYKERMNAKIQGTHSVPAEQQYYVTPSRPGNFGENLDFKVNIDNWFEENR